MPSFDNVKYGFDSSECCPEFAIGEPNGIKIAAPEQFTLPPTPARGQSVRLPLCLTVEFDGLYLSRFAHVYEAVKVVVVDDQRNETFTGGVWRDRHYAAQPESSDVTPQELKAMTITEYNTVNLLEHIPLPLRPATYKIHALLEEHKSNVVTLRVDVK
jgi:hypothetical protein